MFIQFYIYVNYILLCCEESKSCTLVYTCMLACCTLVNTGGFAACSINIGLQTPVAIIQRCSNWVSHISFRLMP